MEENNQIETPVKEEKKKSNTLVIVLIVLVVVLMAVVCYFLLTKGSDEDKPEPVNNTETTSISGVDVTENIPYGTYRYVDNKTSYSDSEKELIEKLDMYVSEISASFTLIDNDKYSQEELSKSPKYDCSAANEGNCVNRFERNSKMTGSDLEVETVLYNTIMYLYEFKNDAFKNEKIGNDALKEIFPSEDEYYDGMDDALDNKLGHIISAKDVIKYANKFYNLSLSEDAYKSVKTLKNQGQTDIQGIYLTKFNNEDVYYVYLVADEESESNVNTYYKLEKTDNNIYLYYKAIYNYFDGYDNHESDDNLMIIYKFDGSGKLQIDDNRKLFDEHPEYFTDYKLTFKDNGDGTYTFVSNEPVK